MINKRYANFVEVFVTGRRRRAEPSKNVLYILVQYHELGLFIHIFLSVCMNTQNSVIIEARDTKFDI